MGLGHIAGQIEVDNRELVQWVTFGHFAPAPNKKYHGSMVVAVGVYGDTIIVQDEFKGLTNSPWQFEDFSNFAFKGTSDFEPGVYRFDGWYKKFKNGNCRFGGGKFRRVELCET